MPEKVTWVPLTLTFAIEGFELLETYNAPEPIFVAVTLAEEPALSTTAFWLKAREFVELTVGHATVGDFGPLVPFKIAVTSVPEVRPYVALDTTVEKEPVESVEPSEVICGPEPVSVYERRTLTFGSPVIVI